MPNLYTDGELCRRYLQLESERISIIDETADQPDPAGRYRTIQAEQRTIRTARGDEQFSRFAAEWL